MVSRTRLEEVLATYELAWKNRDPDLILNIFTPDAVYHERVLQEPHKDHSGIRQYWVDKVVGEQRDVNFKLLATYQDGDTAIAEWEAEFTDIVRNRRVRMREVAILEFSGDKISHLREYWQSVSSPLTSTRDS